MKRSVFLTRSIALFVTVSLVAHWRLVPWFFQDPLSLGGLVFLIYLGLSVAACAGLLQLRVWGFYSFYASVILGTIMLSLTFIPIPLSFLPVGERWIGLTVLNAIALIAGVVAQRWVRVDASAPVPQSAA
jgi:hypothetical protein